jgi:FMN-dependent NADH-azoreductase
VNVLHIDSSALGAASASRQLSAAAVQILRDSNADVNVIYRDFAEKPPAHLSPALLQALRPQPGARVDPVREVADELHLTETLISEFLDADVVVLGAPMYNFSVPSSLKAWIDRVAQAGRTFRYTEKGPVGLAGGKKVLIVSSRGSAMSGTPVEAALDHQEAYLKAVMGFLGVTDVTVIRAEGLAFGPDAREQAIERALAELKLLSEEFA